MTDYGTCPDCDTDIPTNSRICPECRYSGKGAWALSLKLFTYGSILCIFIFTAPIGLPMVIIGLLGLLLTGRWHTRPTEVEYVH